MATNFTELVFQKLGLLFQKYNLITYSVHDNSVRLFSDQITLLISYDERENGGSLYAGKTENSLNLIDGRIIQKFFIPDLENHFNIPEKNKKDFIENLYIFFKGNGKKILSGDQICFEEIRKEQRHQNKEYAKRIILEQNLQFATKAWKASNY